MLTEWKNLTQLLEGIEADWKERDAALKKLSTALSIGSLEAITFLNAYPQTIAIQLTDLRSNIVREASEVIRNVAFHKNRLKASPEKFVESLLRSPQLHRALSSANKLMGSYVTEAISSLAKAELIAHQGMTLLNTLALESKNVTLRERIAGIFLEHLTAAPQGSGRQASTEALRSFKKAAEMYAVDPSSSVRKLGRSAETLLKGPSSPAPSKKDWSLPPSPVSRSTFPESSSKDSLASPRSRPSLSVFQERRTHRELSTLRTAKLPSTFQKAQTKKELVPPSPVARTVLQSRGTPPPQSRLAFRTLLRDYQGCAEDNKRQELQIRLERTDLATFGDQFLPIVLDEDPLPPWLLKMVLRQFPFIAFADYFVSHNSSQSIDFLRKKLRAGPAVAPDELNYVKDQVLLNARDASLTDAFRRENLRLLSDFKFPQTLNEKTLIKRVEIDLITATRPGVRSEGAGRRNLADSLDEPTVRAELEDTNKLIEDLCRAAGDSPVSQLYSLSSRVGAFAAAGQPVEKLIVRLSSLRPQDAEFHISLFEACLSSFAIHAEENPESATCALELSHKEELLELLLQKLEDIFAEITSLNNVLRFLTVLVRLSPSVYEGDEFESVLKDSLPRIVFVVQKRFVAHSNADVRKNATKLFAELQTIFPSQTLSLVMKEFSSE